MDLSEFRKFAGLVSARPTLEEACADEDALGSPPEDLIGDAETTNELADSERMAEMKLGIAMSHLGYQGAGAGFAGPAAKAAVTPGPHGTDSQIGGKTRKARAVPGDIPGAMLRTK